jgi:antitoxin Phd
VRSWPAEDAKARFGELLEATAKEGPQLVTERGVEAAVLVPVAEWRRLNRGAGPTLKELLLAEAPRGDIPVPPRGGPRWRDPPDLG